MTLAPGKNEKCHKLKVTLFMNLQTEDKVKTYLFKQKSSRAL